MGLKLLHTSDIHLGAKLVYLGANADVQRQQIADTFVRVVDMALDKKVDLFLITGDVFDSKYPSRASVMLVTDQIMRLTEAGTYVALIPGNHDRYEDGCIYLKQQFANLKSEKFRLFTEPKATQWFIAALDVTVHGAAVTMQKNKNSQLPSYIKNHDSKYNVGLIHGGVSLQAEADNYPISKDDIDALKYDYLAIGDWHSTLDVSTPNTVAWYAGSPEILATSQKNSGNVLYVELVESSKKAKVEPIIMAKRKIKEVEIDIGQYKNLFDLQKAVAQYKNKDTFLKLNLTGLKSVSFGGNLSDMMEDITKDFFYIDFHDKTRLQLSDDALKNFPDEFVTGKYIRLLQGQKSEDEVQNKIIDEAMQLGVKLLEGDG